jgi:hypothetical protein
MASYMTRSTHGKRKSEIQGIIQAAELSEPEPLTEPSAPVTVQERNSRPREAARRERARRIKEAPQRTREGIEEEARWTFLASTLGPSGEVFVGKAISSKDKEEIQRLKYEADKRMTQGYDEAFARYTSGLCDASALDEWEMEVEEAEEDEVVAVQPEVRKSRVV